MRSLRQPIKDCNPAVEAGIAIPHRKILTLNVTTVYEKFKGYEIFYEEELRNSGSYPLSCRPSNAIQFRIRLLHLWLRALIYCFCSQNAFKIKIGQSLTNIAHE
jgi:hypothetical protein